jgi:uncharacterized protein YndB with AHSA1/START domain
MNKAIFTENPEHKTMTVERSFDAPRERVWAAWTQSELLEKWWAPLPWKARTRSFDFTEGGHWHYYMEGPKGERHWCLVRYRTIETLKRFAGFDGFCDEEGTPNPDMPAMDWNNAFGGDGKRTDVRVTITFVSAEDMKRIVEMGFREGFTMGLDQLDAMLTGE